MQPHGSPGAADETERDVTALTAEARAGGWTHTRPRDWTGSAAAASLLVQAVHQARHATKTSQATNIKVPKSALSPITVAPVGDSTRVRALVRGAVAAAVPVVELLADDSLVLLEVAAAKRGERTGGVINIARKLVKTYAQLAGALLLSNGRAQTEVRGPGVAASFATQHGHLAGWLKARLGGVVGEHKLTEAAADIAEVRDAIAPGIFTADTLKKVVRLLGGRKRSKRWLSTKGGMGDGAWGSHLVAADLRRSMR